MMNTIVKVWNVTYKHPFTNETVKTVVYAKNRKEAVKKARDNNVPTMGETFFYEIVSIEEAVS